MTQPAAPRLIEAMPDLVLELGRDGVISGHAGGSAVAALRPKGDATGRTLESIWPAGVAAAVRQGARKALALRSTLEMRIGDQSEHYQVRITPQGPERALCMVRAELPRGAIADAAAATSEFRKPHLDRRGFMHNFYATISQCQITEAPAAAVVVQLEGVAAISRSVDPTVSDEVVSNAILRLPAGGYSIGQLNKSTLALLMESSDRAVIEGVLARICGSLRQPIAHGDSVFHVVPFAGVAILGRDASSAKDLLNHARIAAVEARRSKMREAHFFSDTVRLRSLARLDITFELKAAIAEGGIGTRYIGRHDLEAGHLVALVSYARWTHPLRGDIAPKEFLGLAESTGASVALSRAMLEALRADFTRLAPQLPPELRFSFGPLRHHLLHEDFVTDIDRLIEGGLPGERLEIRVAERTFIVLQPSVCTRLVQRGVRLVVDELGRGMGSLDRLARAPLWGVQLDRSWVQGLREDAVALRVCRAGIGAAAALGLVPIVSGVDSDEQRRALLQLGCRYGSGELFPAPRPAAGDAGVARCA